jgi:hypothetical protein
MLNDLVLDALGYALTLPAREGETVESYTARLHAAVWATSGRRKGFCVGGHWLCYTAVDAAGKFTCEGLD